MSTIVERNQDISQIPNGEFIFCKELSKGFIKRDISSLSSVQFEAVANEIESLSLEVLNTLGLDSVQFGGNLKENQGEIEISHKLSSSINKKMEGLPFGTSKEKVLNFVSMQKQKSRYFDIDISKVKRGSCITIKGADSITGYIVKVSEPSGRIVGETIVLDDKSYEVKVCNLSVGRFQLTISIYNNDKILVDEFTSEVEVYDENIAERLKENGETPYISTPVRGIATPGEQITLFNTTCDIVGMGTADSDGRYSITPVGLTLSDNNVSVSISNQSGYISNDSITKQITPTISEYTPTSQPTLRPVTITAQETKTISISSLPQEKETLSDNIRPFLSGNGPIRNIIIVTDNNNIEIGRGLVNSEGNYKVFLHNIPMDYDGEIKITFKDIGLLVFPRLKYVNISNIQTTTQYKMLGFQLKIGDLIVDQSMTNAVEQGSEGHSSYFLYFHESKYGSPLSNSVNKTNKTLITLNNSIELDDYLQIDRIAGSFWSSNQRIKGFELEFLDENMNVIDATSFSGLDKSNGANHWYWGIDCDYPLLYDKIFY